MRAVLSPKSNSTLFHLCFCWPGQSVSKCIFNLLNSFSQPLATYRPWQQKWISFRKPQNVRVAGLQEMEYEKLYKFKEQL